MNTNKLALRGGPYTDERLNAGGGADRGVSAPMSRGGVARVPTEAV